MTVPVLMIVEDNPMNMLVLRTMLKSAGYAPVEARDGLEAVEAAVRHHPDLILMDIMMPRLDGMAAASLIRDQAGERSPKMVAVTGDTTEARRSACSAAGFDGFISKPIDMTELLATVSRLLEPETST